MPESSENLREALLDLERARRAERELRMQTEGLLRGLELLGSTQGNRETFSQLLELFGDLLEFEEAFVLSGATYEQMTPIATTTPGFDELVWHGGDVTQRAIRREPVAVFDASMIPEWKQIELEDAPTVVSALHIGLRDEPKASMLVCTHSEPGFFAPEHVQLARRFSMLATQALLNRDLRELKLQAFERSMRDEFFSVSQDLMAILDFDGQFQQANPATREHLGYGLDHLCDLSFLSLVDDRDRQVVTARLDRVTHAGDATTFEARFGRADGTTGWFQWNLSASPDDRLIYAAGRDITQKHDSEQRLRKLNEDLRTARDEALEANRAKSAFLANMSHELRTPLNAVIGYSELLTEDLRREHACHSHLEDLDRIKTAGNHLLSLIKEILDLSKIESGRTQVHIASVDLVDLLDEVCETVTPLVAEHNNELETSYRDDLGIISTDETKLRQILLNLLSNAAKFTENGIITVEATRESAAGELVVRVSDTGIGIEDDKIDQIFAAFTQADQSTTRAFGGTGLGLTITRHFCALLGGDIDVSSTPGEGSTFTVRFPVE